MGHAERALSFGLFFALALGPADAFGYCRTTTCDAANPNATCTRDENLCSTTGIPLFWPSSCLSFYVQKDGSPKRHISYQTFDGIIRTALNQWTATSCAGGGHPKLKIWDLGTSDATGPEYDQTKQNTNVWMFRDDDWPYKGAAATLALTTVSFGLKSGKILDADVEVNSFLNVLTTSDTAPQADLQSIVTHEAGHFLGMAHSAKQDATMFASYSPGDLSFRTLSDDDHQGICAAYPPGTFECSSPAPSGATTASSDDRPAATCAFSSGGSSDGTGAALLGLGLVIAAIGARGTRRRV